MFLTSFRWLRLLKCWLPLWSFLSLVGHPFCCSMSGRQWPWYPQQTFGVGIGYTLHECGCNFSLKSTVVQMCLSIIWHLSKYLFNTEILIICKLSVIYIWFINFSQFRRAFQQQLICFRRKNPSNPDVTEVWTTGNSKQKDGSASINVMSLSPTKKRDLRKSITRVEIICVLY